MAFFGVFGYELDPTTLTADERAEIADQIAFYVRNRDLFQRGRFVRLASPFEGDRNETAWMVVAPDRRRAIVGYYRSSTGPIPGPDRLRLRGLDPGATYAVTPWPADGVDRSSASHAGEQAGAELMAAGIALELGRHETMTRGDFWAWLFVLDAR